MRVLHVIPSVGPARGGPSTAVLGMLSALAARGVELTLATTDDDGPGRSRVPLGQPLTEDGVARWYFPRQTRFYTVSCPLGAWVRQQVSRFDLVHVHAVFSYSSLPAAFWARRAGVPYMVTLHGILRSWGMRQRRPLLKRLSFPFIERRILGHASLLHFTSQQERLEAEALGVTAPAAVIPLGVDLSQFQRLPAPGAFRQRYPQLEGRQLVLFLGRLDPVKGLDLLLPAFARVRQARPDAALVVAGSGTSTFEALLRRQVQAEGLEADVLLLSFLEGEAKLAALVDSDVFVLPSYSESFGVTVVEAMACGLPVVISERVGISQEVAAGDAGLVVPCQVDALAGALLTLLDDAAMRKRLGANGRRLAHDVFSLEAMGARLVEAYAQVVAAKRAAA